MAPTIYLVRHAQGFHNLSTENEQLHDPDLTPLGLEQCEALCKKFDAHDSITHLVASPMRRTIYTCLRSFEPVVKRGVQVIALPDAQEISGQPCDIGTDLAKIKEEFGSQVDFSRVQDDWHVKTHESKYYPITDKLVARARDARLWLRDLVQAHGEDAKVVLVTHGGILHFVTEDYDGVVMEKGTGWENTEIRSYEFVDPTYQDPGASLKENQSSWRQRRGSVIKLTETEQRELRVAFQNRLEEERIKNKW